MPGNAPDSAKPSSILSSTKLTGPRTKAMHEAATPQATQMQASHTGPPNLSSRKLLGIWPAAYARKKAPAKQEGSRRAAQVASPAMHRLTASSQWMQMLKVVVA